jgi:formylglycine-generating enzyme required for sulfatase activity
LAFGVAVRSAILVCLALPVANGLSCRGAEAPRPMPAPAVQATWDVSGGPGAAEDAPAVSRAVEDATGESGVLEGVRPEAVPSGYVAVPEGGVDASGRPLLLRSLRDDSPMVFVPAGTFRSGLDAAQLRRLAEIEAPPSPGAGDDSEDAAARAGRPSRTDRAEAAFAADMRPAAEVRLGAFYVDRHEVTNAQYRRFLAAQDDATHRPGLRYHADGYNLAPRDEEQFYDPWQDPDWNADDQPVTCVSADDAEAYARWVGRRIPTRDEWERAAVGDGGRLFPWGADLTTDTCRCGLILPAAEPAEPPSMGLVEAVVSLAEVVREIADPAPAIPARVEAYSQDVSPCGCYDLGGNVSEWVRVPPAGGGAWEHVVLGGNAGSVLPSHIVPGRWQVYQAPGKLVGFRTVLRVEATAADGE